MGNEQTHGDNLLSDGSNPSQRQGQDQRLESSAQKYGPINPIVESIPSHSTLPFPYQNNSGPSAQARHLQHPYGILPLQETPSTFPVTGNIPSALLDSTRESVGVQSHSQHAQQQSRRESSAALTPAAFYQFPRGAQFAGQAVSPMDGNQSSNRNLLHTQLRQGFSGAYNQHHGHYENMPGTHIMAPNINHNLYPTYPHSEQYAYWPNFYSNLAVLAPGTYQNPSLFERRSSAPLIQGRYYSGAMNSMVHNPNANRSTTIKVVGSDYGILTASASKPSLHSKLAN